MTDQEITLEYVGAFMRERRKALAFPPALEARFVRDTWSRRSRLLRATTLKLAFVYNIFLLGDWYLAHDAFFASVAMHLLLVTPWMLFVAWYVERAATAHRRELAAASAPVAMVLQVVAIFCITKSPFAPYYLFFVIIATIGANSVHRLAQKYASAGSQIIFLCLVLAIWYRNDMPTEIEVMHSITFFIAATVTLSSNRIIDRDQRRFYLHSLHDRLAAERAAALANCDALTGIASRHHLYARAEDVWRRASEMSPIAVVIFDLDFFKAFNDCFGHSAGDVCLQRVAACASAALRNKDDLAVRYGGEEFLLLLPRTELVEAVRIAENVRLALADLGIPTGNVEAEAVMTGSFGVTSGMASSHTLDALIAQADTALYAAKRSGRNQVWPPLLRVEAARAAMQVRPVFAGMG